MRIKASVTVPFPSETVVLLAGHACPVPFDAVTDDELGKFLKPWCHNKIVRSQLRNPGKTGLWKRGRKEIAAHVSVLGTSGEWTQACSVFSPPLGMSTWDFGN